MTAPWKLFKKSALKGRAMARLAHGAAAPTAFGLIDNEDSSFSVTGVDSQGFPVDISANYSLSPAPTSDTTTVLTVDPPNGMTFLVHGIAPGSANVTTSATPNDGSSQALVAVTPVNVATGPAAGLVVTAGTPVARP